MPQRMHTYPLKTGFAYGLDDASAETIRGIERSVGPAEDQLVGPSFGHGHHDAASARASTSAACPLHLQGRGRSGLLAAPRARIARIDALTYNPGQAEVFFASRVPMPVPRDPDSLGSDRRTISPIRDRLFFVQAAFFGMTSRSITALSIESRSNRFWIFSQYCAEVPK